MEVFTYKPGWTFQPSGEYMLVSKGPHPLDAPYPSTFTVDLGRDTQDAIKLVNTFNSNLLRRVLMHCSEGFSTARLEGKQGLLLQDMVELTTMPSGMTLSVSSSGNALSVSVKVPPVTSTAPRELCPDTYITVQTQRHLDLDLRLFRYRADVLSLIEDLCIHEHSEWFKVLGAHWKFPHPEMSWGTAFDNHSRLRDDLRTTDGRWLLSTQSAYCNRPGSHVRYISQDYTHNLDKGQYAYEYPN
jgi:hypothetical protein